MTDNPAAETIYADNILSAREQAEAREIAQQLDANLALPDYPQGMIVEVGAALLALAIARTRGAGFDQANIDSLKNYVSTRAEELLTP